jgi:hypothetical protein
MTRDKKLELAVTVACIAVVAVTIVVSAVFMLLS